MATIQQIQKGFAAFVDNEVASAYTGIEKALVLGGATLIAANLPNTIHQYTSNAFVEALGIYHKTTDSIDIDAAYNAFVPNMGEEKIPIELPKMGKLNLGTIKIGKQELEMLVKYIKEA